MANARKNRKPSFFWQGLLILLPVAVMAAIGLAAILRDKATAEQEARQRASELLPPLAQELSQRVADELAEFNYSARTWVGRHIAKLHTLPEMELPRYVSTVGEPPGKPPGWLQGGDHDTQLAKWGAAYPELRAAEVFPARLAFATDGTLISPPAYDPAPRPPPWLVGLSTEQRRAWEAIRKAQLARVKYEQLDALIKAFLALDPPPDARANAEFIGIEGLSETPGSNKLQYQFPFAERYRGVLAESGVPLSNLAVAWLLRVEALKAPDSTDAHPGRDDWAVEMEILKAPSILIPSLLDQASILFKGDAEHQRRIKKVGQLWFGQQWLRQITADLRRATDVRGRMSTNLWLNSDFSPWSSRWFCVLQPGQPPNDSATVARVYPKPAIEAAFARVVRQAALPIPDYCGLTAELEGEPLALDPAPPSGGKVAKILATSQTRLLFRELVPGQSKKVDLEMNSLPSQPRLTFQLLLVDPERLFARQRQRMLLFGGLIVASGLAAMAGLLTARRAFYRQLRLNELKSNFVSSVSHELRAPIASVRLMAESLERGKIPDAPKQQEYFRFIGQECRRLSSLIENVLDFSRIEQGRKQYEFEPTDLPALAEQTVKLMATYAAERQVKLTLQIPVEHRTILSSQPVIDGKAIQQALVNLIDNAVKHSPNGETVSVGIEVRGSESKVQEEKSEVRSPKSEVEEEKPDTHHASRITYHVSRITLWVEDHGPGIPAAEHERIFERFYRLGSELRRETQGVGIGLSIVKHIVEAHGGRVLVHSVVGQGSRFTIELPMNQLEVQSPKQT